MTIHKGIAIKTKYSNANQDTQKVVIQNFKFESGFIQWVLELSKTRSIVYA